MTLTWDNPNAWVVMDLWCLFPSSGGVWTPMYAAGSSLGILEYKAGFEAGTACGAALFTYAQSTNVTYAVRSHVFAAPTHAPSSRPGATPSGDSGDSFQPRDGGFHRLQPGQPPPSK